MRVACWSARLMCFQYDMQYRPGSQNLMADCLSCVPLSNSSPAADPDQDLVTEIAAISPLLTALPLTGIKAESEDCSELTQLRQVIHSGWPKPGGSQVCSRENNTHSLALFEHGAYDCRFTITLIDYFSKWPEAAFTPTVTAATVMAFLASVFAQEGNSCLITTDNGPQFASSAFADFLRERGIKHIRTSVYHPQANGCVERFNRVLKDSIQTAQANQQPWKPVVTELLHS